MSAVIIRTIQKGEGYGNRGTSSCLARWRQHQGSVLDSHSISSHDPLPSLICLPYIQNSTPEQLQLSIFMHRLRDILNLQ